MGRFIKDKKFFFLLIFLGIILIASRVLALEPSGLELKWPSSPGTQIMLTVSTPLPELVKYFYEWGIALGGLAVFIALVIAGFQYLTSVGNPAAMKEAMDKIQSAFLGLALLLGSWLILNTINPELTTLRIPPTNWEDIGKLECDTATDCPDSQKYECTDPCPGGCATTTSDSCDSATTTICKEGVCVKKEKEVICGGAHLYSQENWESELYTINLDELKKIDGVGDLHVLSVKAYDASSTDCCDEKAKNEGYYGCGCYVQVFAGQNFWTGRCTDMETVVSACEKNIGNYIDKPLKCVKLISYSTTGTTPPTDHCGDYDPLTDTGPWGACLSAGCKACPKCAGQTGPKTNQLEMSPRPECVSMSTDCGYTCISGSCGAGCGPEAIDPICTDIGCDLNTCQCNTL